MKRVLLCVPGVIFAAATLHAQTQPQPATVPTCVAPSAAFDTASVKPSQIDPRSAHMRGSADSIAASGSIFTMLVSAYDLLHFQVTGGPSWVNDATWDIVAKADQPIANWNDLRSDAKSLIDQQRLQAVLAQRFNLRCHFEMKELPIYNLVVAKGGSKLNPTPADALKKDSLGLDGDSKGMHMQAKGAELAMLAKVLSHGLGRTVIDKTNLPGHYDFTLDYTSDPDISSSTSSNEAVSFPTIFTALEEQLGLKLEPAKGPVPALVIDSIDRPSLN